MSEIELLLMEKLAAKATPADTDTMIVAEGNVLKKSTISQLVTFLKEKLGINSLNTKLSGRNMYVTKALSPELYAAGYSGEDWNVSIYQRYKAVYVTGRVSCMPHRVYSSFAWCRLDVGCTGTSISGNSAYDRLLQLVRR